MKKTVIGLVVLIVVALVIIFVAARTNTAIAPTLDQNGMPTDQETPAGKMVTGSELETFSGTIEAVDTGCFADATCSITVDGKKVVITTGGRGMDPNQQVGKLVGVESIGDAEAQIGAHANVYAKMISANEYTLYGNSQYYVEVIPKK